jgi:hypothetical protein
MRTLRDAVMLLGVLLLLGSVKIAPVGGTGTVVPLTQAGQGFSVGGAEAGAPAMDVTFAPELGAVVPGAVEPGSPVETDCRTSLIVIETVTDNGGEQRVLRIPVTLAAPEAARPSAPHPQALAACSRS